MSPAKQAGRLIAGLDQLGPHDHLCSIYDGQEAHLAVVASFIHIGLNRGEKSIYVPDGSEQIVRAALEVEGVDIERALASNALVLATKETQARAVEMPILSSDTRTTAGAARNDACSIIVALSVDKRFLNLFGFPDWRGFRFGDPRLDCRTKNYHIVGEH